MASKLQEYRRMSEEAQRQLTASLERWQSFLATASRLYKYPYHEQVMIHAQRPDATACAEFDVWNNTMRRYVRRGSKGIALIDTSGDRERLRYVFDVSDTGTRPNSRKLSHTVANGCACCKHHALAAGQLIDVAAFQQHIGGFLRIRCRESGHIAHLCIKEQVLEGVCLVHIEPVNAQLLKGICSCSERKRFMESCSNSVPAGYPLFSSSGGSGSSAVNCTPARSE